MMYSMVVGVCVGSGVGVDAVGTTVKVKGAVVEVVCIESFTIQ